MPKLANVKSFVKKEVKRAEKKQHGKPKRSAPKRNAWPKQKAGRKAHGGAPKELTNKLAQLAVGDTIERREAVELAKAMCCPNMYPSFGVQDGYSSMPTSASGPYMCEPASPDTTNDGSAADANGIPHDESCAIATRDPRCALRFYDGQSRNFRYNLADQDDNETFDILGGEEFEPSYATFDPNTTTAVHGQKLYAGSTKEGPASGHPLILAQHNEILEANGFAASTSVTVYIWVLSGNKFLQYRATATTDVGGSWSAPFSSFSMVHDPAATLTSVKFFHFGRISFSTNATDCNIAIFGNGIPVMCQRELAGFSDVAPLVDKIRYCALNLMYSNTAPALNRNGFATGWQVPSDKDPFQIFQAGFEALANQPGAERMIADQGIHGFWKSTDPLDWEYLEVGADSQEGESGYYEIDSDSDYLMIMTKIPVKEGRAGYWTVFTDVQYRHNSVWFPTMFPKHDRKTFELALEIQGRLPQWHCNPFHIKDIFKWIGNHKNQIQSTITMGAQMFGGVRAEGYANRANDFINLWFK